MCYYMYYTIRVAVPSPQKLGFQAVCVAMHSINLEAEPGIKLQIFLHARGYQAFFVFNSAEHGISATH